MYKMIWLVALAILASAAPAQDKMAYVPGFGSDYATDVYSGYLDVGNINRGLHYVFVESAKGKQNSDPLTLWLNGGPGCSSLLGYLQEIGPYYLEDGVNYKIGDKLTPNPYSWHLVSNLLFLESPAGVGYSFNLDKKFTYNDSITAEDSFNALLNFFVNYPEYSKSKFFIAGESYAGKYIPDLAVLIDKYNAKQAINNKINLKGILVGNGVMTFDTLEQSEIQFVIKKDLVDPEIVPIYEKYCKKDLESDQCQKFLEKYDKDTDGLNPYAIYDYCYYNDSDASPPKSKAKNTRKYETQQSILAKFIKKLSPKRNYDLGDNQGAPCAYFDGVFNYFNLHNKEYNAKWSSQQWNGPCADNITYDIDQKGSIEAYKYLISRRVNIALYNGNADAVVPFIDTFKGIEILKLIRNSNYEPWFTDDQHSGFSQGFTGLTYVIFKGASHQVPQAKRPQSLNFFKNLIVNFRENEPQTTQLTIAEDS